MTASSQSSEIEPNHGDSSLPEETNTMPQEEQQKERSKAFCHCSCSCIGCTCHQRTISSVNCLASRSSYDLEPNSLASNFSELTFGESFESNMDFDMDQLFQCRQDCVDSHCSASGADEIYNEEDIDLEEVDRDPQAFLKDRRQSDDSSTAAYDGEPLIFGEMDLDGSMVVNLGGDEEPMMMSYVSAQSLASGHASAIVKDAGAMFDSNESTSTKLKSDLGG
ncbi:MAG: hypothetical protein Q9227_003686 [Pyrenula ochraceoflavens]